MANALMCDNCQAALPVERVDGWLTVGRIDVQDHPALPRFFAVNPLTGEASWPDGPEPSLADDPLRKDNAQFCTEQCAIEYLERRLAWRQALTEAEVATDGGA